MKIGRPRLCSCREGTVRWSPWMAKHGRTDVHTLLKSGHTHDGCCVYHVGERCRLVSESDSDRQANLF